MELNAKNIAIIFAGGVGQRLNGEDSLPKQFLKVNDKPIIIHTLELFQQNKNIDCIYISIIKDYFEYMQEMVKYYHLTKVAGIVEGGKTGQDSIYKALKLALSENSRESIVLVHDGVRPNITQEVIDKNIENARVYGTAITCTPCYETVVVSEDGKTPTHIPYRKETFSVQAPQTFKLGELVDIHEKERAINPNYENITDSCTLLKKQGIAPSLIQGNFGNIKITTIEDLYILRALIRFREDIDAFGIDNKK